MNTWHWIKNNDFPKIGQEVWVIAKEYTGYYTTIANFSDDLYCLDNIEFSNYKDKKHSGFYLFSNEWGSFNEINNVICWMELPEFPDELKNTN